MHAPSSCSLMGEIWEEDPEVRADTRYHVRRISPITAFDPKNEKTAAIIIGALGGSLDRTRRLTPRIAHGRASGAGCRRLGLLSAAQI